jgi:hypothetical protein
MPNVPIGTMLNSNFDPTPIVVNGTQKTGFTPSNFGYTNNTIPPNMEMRTPINAKLPDMPRVPSPVQAQIPHQSQTSQAWTPKISPQVPPNPQASEQIQRPPDPIPEVDPVQDAKFRADYRVKFSILREAYPHMNIPDIEPQQSHEQIIAMYKEYVKKIHIDSSVESNSTYLIILWLLMEVVGTKFLGLPIQGYFQNQFKYMNKYNMLLIELGETSYVAGVGEGWPVEVRILTMALFNAIIFVVVKMLAGKIGEEYGDKIGNIIDDYLTNNKNKGKDALKRAEEADSDHVPTSQPKPAEPLGGLGPLLGSIMGMFTGGGNGDKSGGDSDDDDEPKPKAKETKRSKEEKPSKRPERKRPVGFASRMRANNKAVSSSDDEDNQGGHDVESDNE